jgi:CRISPR-associated protein Csm4
MMEEKRFSAFKLYFRSGLHLSLGKEDNYDRSQVRLHSDTLKSALFVTAMELYPELRERAEQEAFFDSFRLSSAFPFLDTAEKTLFFLPRPAGNFDLQFSGEEGQENNRKRLQRIEYVEQETLRRIIQGQKEIEHTNWLTDDGKFLAFDSELAGQTLFRNALQQHVSIPRGGVDDGRPFSVDRVFFGKQAGLYFLVDTEQPQMIDKIKAVLKLLGDTGIGTDKSMGAGQFESVRHEKDFIWSFEAENAQRQLNLSMYWPDREELQGMSDSVYRLVRRGGYIASPQRGDHLSIRKRSVYMIEEGAVFGYPLSLNGRRGDLRPDNNALALAGVPAVEHPVWRDGTAVFLPL